MFISVSKPPAVSASTSKIKSLSKSIFMQGNTQLITSSTVSQEPLIVSVLGLFINFPSVHGVANWKLVAVENEKAEVNSRNECATWCMETWDIIVIMMG